jgi:hypothetical protein
MRREHVSSSSIASIGYSTDAGTLEVEFVTGRVYRYRDVKEGTYDALIGASSKGRFFNEHIKDAYPFECVR